MICRDYMLRVCNRQSCHMQHKVLLCNNTICRGNNLCKRVHLTDDELDEANNNIRPFRKNVYKEMKRLAYVLKESYPKDLMTQVCTINMLGECLWTCQTCEANGTAFIRMFFKSFLLLLFNKLSLYTILI